MAVKCPSAPAALLHFFRATPRRSQINKSRDKTTILIKKRSGQGQAATELAAGLVLIIPLIIISIYIGVQCVQAYTIYCTLKQASALAARRFAIAYMHDPTGVKNNWADSCLSVQYPGVVNSYRQFELVEFSPDKIPPTVTLKVSFEPDEFGCRHFPEPDLLGVGKYFKITAQATEKLD